MIKPLNEMDRRFIEDKPLSDRRKLEKPKLKSLAYDVVKLNDKEKTKK